MSNVIEDIINELAAVSEDVCEYACKYREEYGDTDALINERCGECPMMKLIY